MWNEWFLNFHVYGRYVQETKIYENISICKEFLYSCTYIVNIEFCFHILQPHALFYLFFLIHKEKNLFFLFFIQGPQDSLLNKLNAIYFASAWSLSFWQEHKFVVTCGILFVRKIIIHISEYVCTMYII